MKEIDWAKINYELSEPFPLEVVNIRQTGSEGFKKVYAAYIDARDVQDRLDEVVGPGNWSDIYEKVEFKRTERVDVTPEELKAEYKKIKRALSSAYQKKNSNDIDSLTNKQLELEKQFVYEWRDVSYAGVNCVLSIFGVAKSDIGTPSMSEKEKGGYSDALKRAGVKWGIGRYLYKLGNLYSDNKENEIPQWARPKDKPPFEVAFWDLIKKLVSTGDPEIGEIAKSYHPNLSKIEKIELGKRLRMIENKYKQ